MHRTKHRPNAHRSNRGRDNVPRLGLAARVEHALFAATLATMAYIYLAPLLAQSG